MTYREHLEGQLARARTPERKSELEAELALPPFPRELHYVWQAFLAIRRRKSGGWGPEPIGFADIAAYADVLGVRLRPWEVEIVFEIDDLWLASVSESRQG